MTKLKLPKPSPELVAKVRQGGLRAKDCIDLANAGQHEDARELMAALIEVARNEPNELILETGKPAKAKRRGKYVELQPDGSWKRAAKKNPRR